MAIHPSQLQPFSLAGSGSVVGDTVLTLISFNDIDGTALTMAAFGAKGYGTVEPGTTATSTTGEEQISFTGVSANLDGSVSLTGVKNVGFLTPFTETSGMTKLHAGGTRFIIGDESGFFATFANLQNDQTFAGANTFTQKLAVGAVTSSDVADAATVAYVNSVAIAGAPDASETVKGIVQLATNAQMGTHTSSGSTGARLIPPNDQLVKTSSGAGDENKIPVLNASGQLADGFINSTVSSPTGAVIMYGAVTAPSGWLLCDGTSYLRATYAALFAVIGTTYGSADGTHFNVPNFKGNVPVGYNASDTPFNTMGKTGGEQTHTLDLTEIPSHHHTEQVCDSSTGGNARAQQTVTATGNQALSGDSGGGGAHNNLQPYLTLQFLIKT